MNLAGPAPFSRATAGFGFIHRTGGHRALTFIAAIAIVVGLGAPPLFATPISVDYLEANGLAARATFELLDGGNTLQIVLENTSTAPYGGDGVNGDANMVLSSLNFDLGDSVDIVDGTVSLYGTSSVVMNMMGTWTTQATPNLNEQFGFSNGGIGNSPAPFAGALHSVTSHGNGGTLVTNFEGTGNRDGLDYGLVAAGSTSFGNSKFILDAVDIRLSLSAPLADLSFLAKGSYVEFGSDYLYVPVPEPSSWMLGGLAFAAIAVFKRRFGKAAKS